MLGWISGAVYVENLFNIQRWRLPRFIDKFIAKKPVAAAESDVLAANQNPVTSAFGQTLISEANIEQLVSMGFTDRSAVERALRETGDNLEAAVNVLLHANHA